MDANPKRPTDSMSYIAIVFFVLGLITALVSYGLLAWIGLALAVISWRRREPKASIAVALNTGLLLVNFVGFYLPRLLAWQYLLSYSYFSFFLVFLSLFILLVVTLVFGVRELARSVDYRRRLGGHSLDFLWDKSNYLQIISKPRKVKS